MAGEVGKLHLWCDFNSGWPTGPFWALWYDSTRGPSLEDLESALGLKPGLPVTLCDPDGDFEVDGKLAEEQLQTGARWIAQADMTTLRHLK